MQHDYTDEEIRTAWKHALSLRAFLDALPERPQAQPGPWPGQQEAIDKAFLKADQTWVCAYEESPDWGLHSENRLAIAQAYDAARPQAAEIASLKEALLQAQEAAKDLLAQRDKAQAELAALRQSTQSAQTILADDGRSLGQVAFEAAGWLHKWGASGKSRWQSAAQAVATVVLTQAVRRMEAVPVEELWYAYEAANTGYGGMGAVRARLIAAARGEGQVQEVPQVVHVNTTGCDPMTEETAQALGAMVKAAKETGINGLKEARPVVVNEPPQDEKQPDSSGESEKQTEPAWIPHDGGPCPLKDEEVHLWDFKLRYSGDKQLSAGRPPSEYYLQWEDKQGTQGITAYRVLKWKPGFGPEAKAEPAQPTTAPSWTPAVGDVVRSIPEMALGGQMYWRDLALQIARVWWKCHNIGASLQHGDLDKDIAFSIVCKRHGGRVFHGDTPENAWHKAEEWLLSPDRENFHAACLTPVTAP